MVKFLFALTTFLLFNINIATAQSTQTVAKLNCGLASASAKQRAALAKADRILAVSPQNNSSEQANSASEDRFADSKVSLNTLEPQVEESSDSVEPKISVASIVAPSLWWAQEQFDPFGGRLINDWLTYPQIKQIDLTVNWQLWTLLDYLGRYRFINQFGTVAREYGYSLRIFNQQQQCLALYEYNDRTNPPKWEITIEGLGEDSLQVEPGSSE